MKARALSLKSLYGIDLQDYDALLRAQGSCCAICKSIDTQSRRTSFFAVDHCHETGKVRGLLCHSCNRGIGFLQDSADLIERAAAYLKGV